MLLENYTGDSKVLKAIAHILNRKAPLPLDGDGDAEWGTNGQVLKTDGTGNTYWDDESGGGDSVSWTQLQSTGTKIAEIEINGTSQDVYAPNGGGGGGHTIWNRIKTALTARSNLWFADAKISDASADDATKVEVLTELADETAFDNLPTDGTADGMYAFPDSGITYLDDSMVAHGSGTVKDALDDTADSETVSLSVNPSVENVAYAFAFLTYNKRTRNVTINFAITTENSTKKFNTGMLFIIPEKYRPSSNRYGTGINYLYNSQFPYAYRFVARTDGYLQTDYSQGQCWLCQGVITYTL